MDKNLFDLAQVIHNGPHGGNSKYSVDTIAALIQKYVNDLKRGKSGA